MSGVNKIFKYIHMLCVIGTPSTTLLRKRGVPVNFLKVVDGINVLFASQKDLAQFVRR
jgi:hypothetical protein